jgi:dTDP-4-amino-4,6-dideoxygalactose transaminase
MNDKKVNQLPVLDNNYKPIGIYLRHLLKTRVQLSIPHMGENELEFVRQAFDTNWIAPIGPNIDAFENELAEYVGVKYAAAVSSGTAAIHLSLIILGIKSGDRVVCSSFTFVASANPILYQGATPVFVDSEKETWNMCPLALEKAIISSIEENIKPKAIIVVHLYGQSADMFKIMEISKKYDIPIVEDSAESLGSCYHGKHTGTFGEMGIFSFNGNKIITTSGGGMVVSDNKDFIEKAKFFSTQARDPYPFYEHSHIGYNYRMSNVLAGIGRGQLQVIDERVESRRKIFGNYFNALSHIDGIEWMPEPKSDFSNRWLSCIRLNSKSKVTSHELIDALSNENIEARYLWKPMHLQPLFKDCQYFHMEGGSYSDFLFETGLCIPSASNMTEAQQDRVIKVISQLMS